MGTRLIRVLSLAGLTFVFVACGEDTVTNTVDVFPACSATYPFGTCAEGTVCFEGACTNPGTLCGADNPTGLCGAGRTCFGGGCVLSAALCGAANPIGICQAGRVCDEGACVEPVTETVDVFPPCSAEYPFGTCEAEGEGCLAGACVDLSTLCDIDNLNGLCVEGQTCFGGGCAPSALLCGEANPTGLCEAGNICESGECIASQPVTPPSCGPANIEGPCPEGQTCLGGTCMPESALCSATNEAGVCAIGQLCLEGACAATASLCSGYNPTGTCAGDLECQLGVCMEPLPPEVDPCTVNLYSEQPVIGVHTAVTGRGILQEGIYQFRDSNGNGTLELYEDWRKLEICRAEDLVSRMSVEEVVGLMNSASAIGQVNADGIVTERDTTNIVENHNRQALVRSGSLSGATIVATYLNATQELAEAQPLGIPILFLEDPSHSMNARLWSNWPGTLGLGAINDYDVTWQYGDTVRQEYMAVGYRMQYGPMADLATEPRWSRVSGTFGENAWAVARHVAATIRGFQGSDTGDVRNGIIATPKHFPGHGAEYEGFDAHNYEGRWIVFPGDNFMYHTIPFQAAFDVGARAIMPCYGIFLGQTDWDPEQVSSGFSYGMITLLAKEHMGFEGLVTADWGILGTSRGWGMESLTLPERVAMWYRAGSHQFGSDPVAAIWTAYETGLISDADLDGAAVKILENFFKLGLFENPYVDAPAADGIARSATFRRMGFDAQRLAITILSNRDHGISGNQSPRYLPISGARYTDANGNAAPDPGEYICDTDDDNVVSVYYDGSTDGLVGSDGLDDVLGAYDYTLPGDATTLPVVAVTSFAEADIAVYRFNSQGDLDFEGSSEARTIIDAFRARDGYVSLPMLCEEASGVPVLAWFDPVSQAYVHEPVVVEPTNPNLKIVLVERISNAAIVRPFIQGLVSLDDVLDPDVRCPATGTFPQPLSPTLLYPTIYEENIRAQGGRGVDAFLAEFGAFDRAVLDVLFNLHVPTGEGLPAPEGGWSYGIARLPIEIPSSIEQVQLQFEDLPNDTINPTFRIGAGSGY